MRKRVYKYATGADIPEGAVYVNTVTQTQIEVLRYHAEGVDREWIPCWLVWHYFLVEVAEVGD